MSSTIEGTNPTDAQLITLADRLGWVERDLWYLAEKAGHTSNAAYLRTWEGFGAVIEAMAALGWDYSMAGPDPHAACFGNLPFSKAATLPDAILLAACAALAVRDES